MDEPAKERFGTNEKELWYEWAGEPVRLKRSLGTIKERSGTTKESFGTMAVG